MPGATERDTEGMGLGESGGMRLRGEMKCDYDDVTDAFQAKVRLSDCYGKVSTP